MLNRNSVIFNVWSEDDKKSKESRIVIWERVNKFYIIVCK